MLAADWSLYDLLALGLIRLLPGLFQLPAQVLNPTNGLPFGLPLCSFRIRLGAQVGQGEPSAVGGRQRVGVGEVDLELAVGVFVIVGVRVPTQILHVMQQRGHQIEITARDAPRRSRDGMGRADRGPSR